MTPTFSAAVDPVLLHLIELIEKLEQSQECDPRVERQRLESLMQDAESRLSDGNSWRLARYALAAWIDEMLINASWNGREWWENNSLEFALFKTRDRATKFYTQAKEAADLPKRDALEVFYLCVVLGFRGLYSLDEATFVAEQLDLPASIDSWLKTTAPSLQLQQGRPPIVEAPRDPTGAPPLEGRYLMIGSSLLMAILSALCAVMLYLNEYI